MNIFQNKIANLQIVYGIECTLFGLIYVGETKGQLNPRMNGHIFEVINDGSLPAFRSTRPFFSFLLKVRFLNINKLGTAMLYGCIERIDNTLAHNAFDQLRYIYIARVFFGFHTYIYIVIVWDNFMHGARAMNAEPICVIPHHTDTMKQICL